MRNMAAWSLVNSGDLMGQDTEKDAEQRYPPQPSKQATRAACPFYAIIEKPNSDEQKKSRKTSRLEKPGDP